MTEKEEKYLLERAREAINTAYAPYSGYRVGAAVLSSSGRIYGGCNIEIATYTLTRHAEMVALDKAVSEGERAFEALAVMTDDPAAPFPCALCRQVMKEHCTGDLTVIGATTSGLVRKTTLGALYPEAFGPANLKEEK
jgi:cytidine deaminase